MCLADLDVSAADETREEFAANCPCAEAADRIAKMQFSIPAVRPKLLRASPRSLTVLMLN